MNHNNYEQSNGSQSNLLFSISKGDLQKSFEIIKNLFEKGMNLNFSDKNGNTPLHHAIIKRYYYLIKMMIKYGAKVNIKNK